MARATLPMTAAMTAATAGAAEERLRPASRNAMRGDSGNHRPARAANPSSVGVQMISPISVSATPARMTVAFAEAPNAAERDEYAGPGDRRAEQRHCACGCARCRAVRRARPRRPYAPPRGPGTRPPQGGDEADEREREQFDRAYVEVTGNRVDVSPEGGNADRRERHSHEHAEHAAHDAQHDSLGQHHIAQILAAPADCRDEGEFAALPPCAHRERRSGQQDDLQQGHPADERRRGCGLRVDRRVVVAELVGHLRPGRRIQVHRAREDDEAEPVEVQDLLPAHRSRTSTSQETSAETSFAGPATGIADGRVYAAAVCRKLASADDAHEPERAVRGGGADLVTDRAGRCRAASDRVNAISSAVRGARPLTWRTRPRAMGFA